MGTLGGKERTWVGVRMTWIQILPLTLTDMSLNLSGGPWSHYKKVIVVRIKMG
jgi:hypothetical protein